MSGAVRYEVTIDSTSYLIGITDRFVPAEDLSVGVHSISVKGISADGTASRRSELLAYQVFRPPILHPVQSTPDPGVNLMWDDESSSPLTRIMVINLATNLPVLNTDKTDGSESLIAELADGRYQWMVFSQASQAWSDPAEFTINRSSTMTSSLTQSAGAPVELTWLTVSGADRYEVLVMDDRGLTTYRNYSVTGTTFTVPVQLAAGRTYRTWVRAISSSGSAGPWSAVRQLVIS